MGFVSYEVQPVKDDGCECVVVSDDQADFWSIYGRLPKNKDGHNLAVCLGDFNSRESAEYIMYMIEQGIEKEPAPYAGE